MRQSQYSTTLLLLAAVWCATLSHGFAPSSSLSSSSSRVSVFQTSMVSDKDKNKGGAGDETNSDIPAEEMIGAPSFSSEVDWDAEWKKVMDDQRLGKKAERPGAGFYKTEAEIKAIQAANKAAQQARQVQASLPSWQMLKGDWKVGLRIRGIACPGNE